MLSSPILHVHTCVHVHIARESLCDMFHMPLQVLVLDDLPVSTNINLVEKNMDNDSMVCVSCASVQVHSVHV